MTQKMLRNDVARCFSRSRRYCTVKKYHVFWRSFAKL